MKIRLSKKFIVIAGGVLLLCGGSGAAAVFVGTDKLLGPSYLEVNGLTCTTLQTVKITRDHRTWVRKYVVSDKTGDGMARVKTALRVARAVQEKEKADLVQVAVLDKAGPTERAEMRGRVIGAQVVYIPDLGKAPAGAEAQTYSAFYVDGNPTSKGEYFGLRMDLPLEDVEALSAKLTDKADCVDPVVEAPEGEHGAPAAHGDKKKPKPKGGEHGAAAEGEGHGEGEAKPAGEGHGGSEGKEGGAKEGDAKEGDAKSGEAEVASKEGGGFLSSVTSMIFGSKEAEKPEAKGAETHGSEGEASPAAQTDSGEGHAAPAPRPGDAPVAEGASAPSANGNAPAAAHPAGQVNEAADPAQPHNAADPSHEEGKPAQGTEPSVPKAEAPASEQAPAAAAAAKPEGGLFSSIKGMIFGSGEAEKPQDAGKQTGQEAAADAKPSDNPPPPRTAAEGGKRWSSQTEADAIHGGSGAPALAPKTEAAPPPTNGSTAADAAGAAWLAKFRQQQADAAAAASGAKPAP